MESTAPSSIKPQTISPIDALWALIQGQTKAVRKALAKRILEEEYDEMAQKTLAKSSLTRAFKELHSGQAKHDARALFTQQ